MAGKFEWIIVTDDGEVYGTNRQSTAEAADDIGLVVVKAKDIEEYVTEDDDQDPDEE